MGRVERAGTQVQRHLIRVNEAYHTLLEAHFPEVSLLRGLCVYRWFARSSPSRFRLLEPDLAPATERCGRPRLVQSRWAAPRGASTRARYKSGWFLRPGAAGPRIAARSDGVARGPRGAGRTPAFEAHVNRRSRGKDLSVLERSGAARCVSQLGTACTGTAHLRFPVTSKPWSAPRRGHMSWMARSVPSAATRFLRLVYRRGY